MAGSRFQRLSGESLVYGLGQVSGRAVQFVLVPVLTRVLSPGAYAVSDLVIAYSQTAILVLVMGMDGALARHFYQEPDRAARVRMVSTSLWFRLATSLAVGLVLFGLASSLSTPLMGSPDYGKYLRIGAITLPFTLLVLFANDVLRVTFQPWKFIALNGLQTVLAAGISLWLVCVQKIGVVGVLYGRLGADLVSALFGLVLVRHTIRPQFSAATLRRMAAYGLPLVPGAFAYGVLMGVDRYMLQHTRSLEEVAVYAVGIKFFALMSLAISAFQLAYGPFAYSVAHQSDAPPIFARILLTFVAVGSTGALLLSLFAPEILRWAVPPSYSGAGLLVAWLAFAAVAQGIYSITSIGIGLALRTHLLIWTAGGAMLVACVAQWFLTPRWGAPGAAAATFLAYATSALLTYRVSQRVHVLPYRGGRVLTLVLAGLVLALAIPRLAPAGFAGLGLKLASLAGFALLCGSLRVWTVRGAVAPRSLTRLQA